MAWVGHHVAIFPNVVVDDPSAGKNRSCFRMNPISDLMKSMVQAVMATYRHGYISTDDFELDSGCYFLRMIHTCVVYSFNCGPATSRRFGHFYWGTSRSNVSLAHELQTCCGARAFAAKKMLRPRGMISRTFALGAIGGGSQMAKMLSQHIRSGCDWNWLPNGRIVQHLSHSANIPIIGHRLGVEGCALTCVSLVWEGSLIV
jgi:hypothetical protein